jgi:uncharacterized protein YecE (DUF72 family)
MDYRLGTMGFGYREWAGVFYPPGVPASRYLEHYATRFDCVELDTTFHAAPPAARFRRWASVVPATFRFCIKAPRAVTHDGPPERSIDAMRRFLDDAWAMGEKLAVVLIQLPPTFAASERAGFERFLDALPRHLAYAVEFRHVSWQGVAGPMLSARKIALVAAEYEADPSPPVVTADFLYVRWIGVHDRYPHMNHEVRDPTARLTWWAEQIERCRLSVHTVWGMFNNDYAGYSVASAERFRRLVGLTGPVVPLPSREPGLFD